MIQAKWRKKPDKLLLQPLAADFCDMRSIQCAQTSLPCAHVLLTTRESP